MKRINIALFLFAFFSFGIGSAHAALVADYQFNGTLGSDIQGAPDLVQQGPNPGSYTTDTVFSESCSVFEFSTAFDDDEPIGAGFAVNTSGLISATEYTFVGLFYFETDDEWLRILNFKDQLSDDGFYSGTNGDLTYYLEDDQGGSQTVTAFEYMLVAFTRESDGTVTGYKNGVESFSLDDEGSASIADDLLLIFQDDSNSEHPSGRVASIQFYDTALSSGEIANLAPACGVLPTAPPVPANSPLTLISMIILIGGLGSILLWRRRTI